MWTRAGRKVLGKRRMKREELPVMYVAGSETSLESLKTSIACTKFGSSHPGTHSFPQRKLLRWCFDCLGSGFSLANSTLSKLLFFSPACVCT